MTALVKTHSRTFLGAPMERTARFSGLARRAIRPAVYGWLREISRNVEARFQRASQTAALAPSHSEKMFMFLSTFLQDLRLKPWFEKPAEAGSTVFEISLYQP
jgi:hypothetical protein